ncbi:related to 40S ribosomal protein S30 [Armillaria ostoyae]|uniref:Related to 40S ribosomal protein S30 n=1 Tax=Armillaria ostoyae TaxID=47428 RepID=A0A284QLE2_ARMOS|nr:related to 40S ribosomal protein S30 [Armillaria ostoyae]
MLRPVGTETLCGQLHSRADSVRWPSASASPQDNMGKVHGSLARAGKVKSQTPKVEAQEKKKTPKGRAKKRVLYNRRFVNVTTLPGGKRRM